MNSLRTFIPVSKNQVNLLFARYINGKVKFFDMKKGWGVIVTDETPSRDVFIHQSNIKMDGFRFLEQGEAVSFDVQVGQKGPQAVNVTGKDGAPLVRKNL